MPRATRTATVLALYAAILLCPSCLIGTSSHTDVSGRYVGAETIAQIQAGKSRDYVLALIGEPSDRVVLDDGTEIWKWSYVETRNSHDSVIFLLNSDAQTETQKTTYVEFKDGLVVHAWHD